MAFWMVKSEPEEYSINKMKEEQIGKWDGVKNYQAQKYMKTMKVGDQALFYHTGKERAVVGIVKVFKEYYYDDDPKFGLVDFEFYKIFNKKVNLRDIKVNSHLTNMTIIKQPRLSISSISEEEFNEIVRLSEID
ncbi:thymocyte nuclear protein 1-like [Condylostylus longicornis]|uniref:thymocyte nuclear protein 1-like n=1 Tax=Condylostylus longicornis TaxID=2530218 RepID=UPI00244DE11E|nr:thymocyte nuclear protein 1-like [Condylostylus longicornis]